MDYPSAGMCMELRQSFAAACETNVPYGGEVGHPRVLKVLILLLWEIGLSTSLQRAWGPGGGREEEASAAFAEATAGRGHINTSPLLQQG